MANKSYGSDHKWVNFMSRVAFGLGLFGYEYTSGSCDFESYWAGLNRVFNLVNK